MLLNRGKLLAGSLFAGSLFGGRDVAIVVPPSVQSRSVYAGGSSTRGRKKDVLKDDDEDVLIFLLM
jgi:hypothetical protein